MTDKIIPLGRLIGALGPSLPPAADGQCPGQHCYRLGSVRAPAVEPHPCPFDCDVNDDRESTCACCEVCTQECADDI